jgi:hypothetical protein
MAGLMDSLAAALGGDTGGGGGGLMGIGQMLQNQRQKGMNANMMKLQEDWQKLQMLYEIIRGIGALGGQEQRTGQQTTGGGLQGAIGGVYGGAQIGNALGNFLGNSAASTAPTLNIPWG